MKVPTAQASAGPVADTLASVLSVGFCALACGLTVASTFQIEHGGRPGRAGRRDRADGGTRVVRPEPRVHARGSGLPGGGLVDHDAGGRGASGQ
jgi:hypothetical protein